MCAFVFVYTHTHLHRHTQKAPYIRVLVMKGTQSVLPALTNFNFSFNFCQKISPCCFHAVFHAALFSVLFDMDTEKG